MPKGNINETKVGDIVIKLISDWGIYRANFKLF